MLVGAFVAFYFVGLCAVVAGGEYLDCDPAGYIAVGLFWPLTLPFVAVIALGMLIGGALR